MKMRKTGAPLASLTMILFLSTTIAYAASTMGKGQMFPPPKFGGTRIDLMESNVALPTDAPTYVIHGWDLDRWKSRSKEEQRDFLENYTFELYIDDEWIELKRWRHYYADQDLMKIGFYIEFKAGHFEPRIYTFKGVWRPGNTTVVADIAFHAPG
ncbi:MAG: hypothetical protein NWE88_04915 [Candidatus Bathyarchaeota archaeon]|nr:hypothetical protein [Candidatus Bathyarchaeota archaeon]